uniref:Coatomer subunit zeta n=1 Tax=Cyprinus carpio carpio TaxID=630221 RepID=A0A8C0YLW4_CYPCA
MDTLILEPSLYTVKAVLIMDNDGERLYAKYYDDTYPTVKEQKAFEKNIFNKTHRTDSEIALLEGLTVVYKSNIDLYFYVIGSSHENELMLMSVLNCLFDSLSQMLRKNVEKRALLENMEGLFLAIDEIVDGGLEEQHLSKIEIFCNIINVFIINFDQFKASLLKKKKKFYNNIIF